MLEWPGLTSWDFTSAKGKTQPRFQTGSIYIYRERERSVFEKQYAVSCSFPMCLEVFQSHGPNSVSYIDGDLQDKRNTVLTAAPHLARQKVRAGHWHRLPRRRPFGIRRGHRCSDLGLGHCSSTLISTVPNSEGRCLGRLNMSNVKHIFDRKYGLSTFRMMTPQLTHCLWWFEIINQRRLETHSALMARLTPKNPDSDFGNRLTCPYCKLFFWKCVRMIYGRMKRKYGWTAPWIGKYFWYFGWFWCYFGSQNDSDSSNKHKKCL